MSVASCGISGCAMGSTPIARRTCGEYVTPIASKIGICAAITLPHAPVVNKPIRTARTRGLVRASSSNDSAQVPAFCTNAVPTADETGSIIVPTATYKSVSGFTRMPGRYSGSASSAVTRRGGESSVRRASDRGCEARAERGRAAPALPCAGAPPDSVGAVRRASRAVRGGASARAPSGSVGGVSVRGDGPET